MPSIRLNGPHGNLSAGMLFVFFHKGAEAQANRSIMSQSKGVAELGGAWH